jgi:hypothetical protein
VFNFIKIFSNWAAVAWGDEYKFPTDQKALFVVCHSPFSDSGNKFSG